MRKLSMTTAGVFCGLLWIAASIHAAAADRMQRVDDDTPTFPGDPDIQLPPAFRSFPPSPGARKPSINPGVNAPLVPPAKTPEAARRPPQTRAELLNDLFQRLAAASDKEEASGVAENIQRLWLQSGSDTADLLMSRAAMVMANGQADIATQLLDKVVTLDPDWAEGWNRRATLRFRNNDDFGSMEDILHVLAIEPRHFGALTGMAMILQRSGMKKDALSTLHKAAEIYPHNAEYREDDRRSHAGGRGSAVIEFYRDMLVRPVSIGHG